MLEIGFQLRRTRTSRGDVKGSIGRLRVFIGSNEEEDGDKNYIEDCFNR